MFGQGVGGTNRPEGPKIKKFDISSTSRLKISSEIKIERGEKTPTPKISALLRKRPVLLQADSVLTKDRKWPYYRDFCGKIHREGSCSKAGRGSLVKSRC